MLKKLAYFLRNIQTSRVNNSHILKMKSAKFSGYCFYLNTNIQRDFLIYGSPFRPLKSIPESNFTVSINIGIRENIFTVSINLGIIENILTVFVNPGVLKNIFTVSVNVRIQENNFTVSEFSETV